MPGKRQFHLGHGEGLIRLSEAIKIHKARGWRCPTRTRLGQYIKEKRLKGADWDGWYWWVPPGRIVILPGKTKNGAPKRIHSPSS
jgi:hypothetical protein